MLTRLFTLGHCNFAVFMRLNSCFDELTFIRIIIYQFKVLFLKKYVKRTKIIFSCVVNILNKSKDMFFFTNIQ